MRKIKAGENIELSKEQKEMMLQNAEEAYGRFLTALGYDWENDPNMEKTPYRVAKMYVNEVTSGSYSEKPKIATFPNTNHYTGMVFEGNIRVHSLCSHHIQPFIGKCAIAYIPTENGKIVGLSKLNRIVHWFAKRPQLQEQLTKQIHDYLAEILGENQGIAVYVEAQHMCVKLRGAEDDSNTCTAFMSGYFLDDSLHSREEFYQMIQNCKK